MEGSIEGGKVRRSEFDGAQRKTAAMAEAVVFWSLGSGKRRENARNRVQGCHWFWSAREIELRGAALLGPRRRRGGNREEVLGGVAKGGSSSARPRAVEEEQRDAWAPARSKGEVGVGRGRPRAAGGRRTAPAARESRERDRGRGKGIYLQFPKFPGT